MLSNDEKLKLFDELLANALVLSRWYVRTAPAEFCAERTAAKNVDAVRALRDADRPGQALLPDGVLSAEDYEAFQQLLNAPAKVLPGLAEAMRKRRQNREPEQAPQGAPPDSAQALADVAYLDAAACRHGTRLGIPSKIPGYDPGDADHIHFVLMPIGAGARRAAVEWLKTQEPADTTKPGEP